MVRMALHYLSLLLFDTPNGVILLKRTPGAIADIETVALSEDSDIRHTAKLLMDKYYGEHLEPETPAPL
ncbi:hypothetical protein IWQ61_010729 [Dispira simplex]|nr:hypothetical protein IWQ61_010729 [Dispira simplex]